MTLFVASCAFFLFIQFIFTFFLGEESGTKWAIRVMLFGHVLLALAGIQGLISGDYYLTYIWLTQVLITLVMFYFANRYGPGKPPIPFSKDNFLKGMLALILIIGIIRGYQYVDAEQTERDIYRMCQAEINAIDARGRLPYPKVIKISKDMNNVGGVEKDLKGRENVKLDIEFTYDKIDKSIVYDNYAGPVNIGKEYVREEWKCTPMEYREENGKYYVLCQLSLPNLFTQTGMEPYGVYFVVDKDNTKEIKYIITDSRVYNADENFTLTTMPYSPLNMPAPLTEEGLTHMVWLNKINHGEKVDVEAKI